MLDKIHKRFTKWYIKRGWSMNYIYGHSELPKDIDIYEYEPKTVFMCPFWVRPLLIFFSPSTYIVDKYGKPLVEGFEYGLTGRYKNGT